MRVAQRIGVVARALPAMSASSTSAARVRAERQSRCCASQASNSALYACAASPEHAVGILRDRRCTPVGAARRSPGPLTTSRRVVSSAGTGAGAGVARGLGVASRPQQACQPDRGVGPSSASQASSAASRGASATEVLCCLLRRRGEPVRGARYGTIASNAATAMLSNGAGAPPARASNAERACHCALKRQRTTSRLASPNSLPQIRHQFAALAVPATLQRHRDWLVVRDAAGGIDSKSSNWCGPLGVGVSCVPAGSSLVMVSV